MLLKPANRKECLGNYQNWVKSREEEEEASDEGIEIANMCTLLTVPAPIIIILQHHWHFENQDMEG